MRAALSAAALLSASPALAQISDEIVRDTVGSYQLVPTDGKPACTIALLPARSTAGEDARRATPGACPHLPAFAKVVAWKLEDGTTLLDARGKTVLHFVEDETALPTWPDLQSPQYYLVPAVAGFTHLPPPAEWAGDWKLWQRGKLVCTITLAPNPGARTGDTRPVSTKACPKNSAAARLSSWSLEDLKLMLWGPNDELFAFEPAPKARWVSEPGGWSLSK